MLHEAHLTTSHLEWGPHTPRTATPNVSPRFLQAIQPQTPRITTPNVSPRFQQATQPQIQDTPFGRCSVKLDTSPGESALAVGHGCDDQDEGEKYVVVVQRDQIVQNLHQNEFQEVLIKLLNAELRNRLDSIDRKLGELQMSSQDGCAPAPCTMTNVSTGRSLQEPNSDQGVRRAGLSFRSSESEVSSDSRLDPLAAIRHVSSGSGPRRRRTWIEATIRNHQNVRGRHAAAVWRFLEDRFSSVSAYVWSFVIPGIVFMSVGLSCWQTVDSYPLSETVTGILHAVFEIVFGVELFLRFLACPDRRVFCRSPLNAIDLLTCLPLGFRLGAAAVGITGDAPDVEDVLSALVVFPVLRLLKLTRRFEKFQLLLSAFLMSVEALPVLLYTMFVIALACSGLIYAVEPRDNISNWPHAMWFALVTMTTCGYGDVTPSTIIGQVITAVLMIVSILYMAMPIGIVGNAFSKTWDARDRLLLMQRIREAFLNQGFSEMAFRDILSLFIGDCDDGLGIEEFHSVLQSMNINISSDRVCMLFSSLDQDGSGTIGVDELLLGLFPNDYAAYFRDLKSSVFSASCQSSNFGTSKSTISLPAA